MLSSTTKNCWNGSKGSSPRTLPSFSAESMRFFMQRFAMFKRFNLSTFHWASLFVSGGALALNVLTRSFPKFSSVSSSSKLADAILFWFLMYAADRIWSGRLFIRPLIPPWMRWFTHDKSHDGLARHVSNARITQNVFKLPAYVNAALLLLLIFWKISQNIRF